MWRFVRDHGIPIALTGGLFFTAFPFFLAPATHDTASCASLATATDCHETMKLPALRRRWSCETKIVVTQIILKEHVPDGGFNGALLRTFGANRLVGDPDRQENANQYKTYNVAVVTLERGSDAWGVSFGGESRIGPTKFGPLYMKGDELAHAIRTSNYGAKQCHETCELGAIDKRLAWSAGFKRLEIGSRIETCVTFAGDTATIEPTISVSRFPTTLIAVDTATCTRRADPLEEMLTKCARRF